MLKEFKEDWMNRVRSQKFLIKLENIKEKQTEQKNTINEIKNIPEEINSRVDDTGE